MIAIVAYLLLLVLSSCSSTARTCADIDFFKTKAIPKWDGLFYCP